MAPLAAGVLVAAVLAAAVVGPAVAVVFPEEVPVAVGNRQFLQLISEADQKRISDQVERHERGTDGEIVPMMVFSSDAYPGAKWRFSILFALFIFAGLGLCPVPLTFTVYLVTLLSSLAVGALLAEIPFFRRLALRHHEVEEEVFQRALQEFDRHKVSQTKNRTGILIYVSYFEHRVLVLADQGINEKIDPELWTEMVDRMIGQIKDGNYTEAFTKAIEACGRILSEHVPKTSNNPNELKNRFIYKM